MSLNAMSSGQARSIKLTGDRLRTFFKKQCTNKDGFIKEELLIGLTNQFSEGSFVLKSGSNWQFHLGSFSPYIENWGVNYLDRGRKIEFAEYHDNIIAELRSTAFIKSFIFKENFFCVYDAPYWLIFDRIDLLEMLQDANQVNWRVLESGRIKGDIYIEDSKRTVFTMEYRAEEHKKQFVLGAHGGGAGERLKNILKDKLFFNAVPVDYEFWQDNLKI
jgi:hypothetical protein